MKFSLPALVQPLAAFCFVIPLMGQAIAAPEPATSVTKRPLDHADFDAWRSIATPALSRDGKWLAYSFQPQDGDGDLVVRNLSTGVESRHPVGKLPPPNLTPNEENPDAPPVPRAIKVAFTGDSRYLVATTYPDRAELAAARKAKLKPEQMPKGGLLIVDLAAGTARKISNVKAVQVPARSGSLIAVLKEEASETPRTPEAGAVSPAVSAPAKGDEDDSPDADSDQAAAARSGDTAREGARKEYGSDLLLLDLAAGGERVIRNVLETGGRDSVSLNVLSRDGETAVYTVSSKNEAENGVYTLAPRQPALAPRPLLAGKGKYLKLVWDREQTQIAFLSDRDDAAAKAPKFKVYRWARGAAAAEELLSAGTAVFPTGMGISEKGAGATLAFSRNGRKLYVPAAPPPKAVTAGETPAEEDKVTADLWRWNDDDIQPLQKIHATQERSRSYRGVYDLAAKTYVQVADSGLRTVSLSDDGERAIGIDEKPYRRMVDYDASYADLYLVNTANGARKLAVKQLRLGGRAPVATEQWSPDGKWVFFFRDKHWHLLNTLDGSERNLTAKLGVAVYDERHDSPGPAGSYGAAGWLSDSSSFLVYDRYDVWQLYADGRTARSLTHGVGRSTGIQMRLQRTEPVEEGEDERGIDPGKELVLRGESEETHASGYYSTAFNAAGAPTRLLWGDKNYRYLGRALDAEVLLLSASRFDTYPDLQVTGARFSAPAKVSDGGAQMQPFLWGSGELMKFTSAKGVPLQAALYKPANFDAKKKYPLLVYIYERLSQNVNSFINPGPGQNINFSLYTSNGYVILAPDIVYTTGYPGKSALDAVLPAIDTLVKQGFIDEKNIGIQGHSWGGYQIAYMITQTNRFRAAEAGAPVGNMTSAYSGIRWGSGLPRQFQYEQSQSRIGKPLQQAPQLYLANSAVFHIQNVHTPLLILANDNDDAVPWYQAIELFLSLRRFGKEAYYLNYNGEFHALRRRADQKDYARRMQQYFDHFLKGAPVPEWMEKGVPYIERDEEKLLFPKLKPGAKIG